MTVAITLLAASVWASWLAFEIVAYSRVKQTPQGEVAIVLGAAVWQNKPSPVFEERIKHAIDLYQQGRVNKILFTGGFGVGKLHAESAVARDYAVSRGVPRSDILIETASKSTLQNLLEAKRLLESCGIRTAILVSDPLHLKRAAVMAEDLGLRTTPSPTQTSRYKTLGAQTKFLVREMYFYQKYLFNRGQSTSL